MGWVNYIVLKKHKVAFTINRTITDTSFSDDINRMESIVSEMNEYGLDIPIDDYTVSDFADTVRLARHTFDLMSEIDFRSIMLIHWLKDNEIEFDILSGSDGTPDEVKDCIVIG